MKDRFKCRGQMIGSNEWVCGYYYIDLCAKPNSFFIRGDEHHDFSVKEETVGQCTGLKDKAGKLIYEGDIVIATKKAVDCRFIIDFDYGSFGARHIGTNTWHSSSTVSFFELVFKIIGNIHENPELLERL